MAEIERVTIPYSPRKAFLPFHERKERWSCIVAHRRAGKTVACINDLIKRAIECDKPSPRLAYVAPTYTQAKDVAFGYLCQYAMAIPGTKTSLGELYVEFPTGARIRLYGADNYDRMRGLYFDHVVIDEAGDIDPRAWSEVIRPALSDRQGGATFIGTPKGRNSFFDIWQAARRDDAWFALMLRASKTELLPAYELESARNMLTPEQYAQEYECSFDAATLGAYYAKDIALAEQDGRITKVPWDKAAPVYAAMDLGIGDSTAIWWAQVVGREVHVIDHYEASGVGLDHYVGQMRQRPYQPYELILPHDAEAKELQTGKSRTEFLTEHGFNCRVLPLHRVEDGINAVRMTLNRCWFDEAKTEHGLDCLRMYRAEYDDKAKVLKPRPLHDWASHSSDAFRYLVMGLDQSPKFRADRRRRERTVEWIV